ncbi:hypothetical protein BGW39_001195 [Mortierella sp. 14UC]|nr:hypothetical protein BGW39_001195 [Mortierella sp. 14UC]
MHSPPLKIRSPSSRTAPKVHLTLTAFRKASPLDLGPVVFDQWARSATNKSDLCTKYRAVASDAVSFEDSDVKAIGKQMQELWEKEQIALKNSWRDQEPLRKLRTRNIMSAAKDSSKMHIAVCRHQLRQALEELQQEQVGKMEESGAKAGARAKAGTGTGTGTGARAGASTARASAADGERGFQCKWYPHLIQEMMTV